MRLIFIRKLWVLGLLTILLNQNALACFMPRERKMQKQMVFAKDATGKKLAYIMRGSFLELHSVSEKKLLERQDFERIGLIAYFLKGRVNGRNGFDNTYVLHLVAVLEKLRSLHRPKSLSYETICKGLAVCRVWLESFVVLPDGGIGNESANILARNANAYFLMMKRNLAMQLI